MTVAPPAEAPAPPARPLWRTLFSPKWLVLLIVALAVATVMSMLGIWQLDVYRSKTAAATAQRAEIPPVPLQSLFSVDEGLPAKAVARRVTVTGTWGPAADQVFVADRRFGERDGYWVLTPVKLAADSAIMIVRGWVPSTSDPAVAAPVGPVSLTGAVAASEAQDASGESAKGRVLSSLRLTSMLDLVDYRLYDAFVVLASVDSGTGQATVAPTVVPAPAPPTERAGLRNVAYGFQWWIFAAFTLWMYGRMLLDAHRGDSRPEPDDTVSG